MKTTFKTFKQSVYDPAFYQTVSEAPLSVAVRHYFKWVLLLAVAMTLALGALLVPQGVLFVKKYAPEMVTTYFPADLAVHIEKGEASVNVAEPYIIAGKGDARSLLQEQGFENMLVIDTKNPFDKTTFEGYKTFALLTKNEIVTQSDRGQITIQSLRTFPTTTIDQASLLSLIEKVRGSLVYIVIFGLFATWFAMVLGYVGYLVLLLLFALIPFFVAHIKKMPLSYGAAYKMSLYAIIPALALKTLLNVLGIFFVPEYFTLLVFMLVVSINMREMEGPTLFDNK